MATEYSASGGHFTNQLMVQLLINDGFLRLKVLQFVSQKLYIFFIILPFFTKEWVQWIHTNN